MAPLILNFNSRTEW